MHIRQELSNMAGCIILKCQHIYEPNHTGFSFIDNKFSFFDATVITEKVCKRNSIKAVGKLFPLAPGDIIRNGSALFLGKGAHKSQHKFTLGVESIDILLLKKDPHALGFQLSDSHKSVYCITSKAGEGLGDNEIDFSVNGICDHTIEAVTIMIGKPRDAVIHIKSYELPPRVLLDIGFKIIGLCFQAVLLFFLFGGHTSVGCDSQLCSRSSTEVPKSGSEFNLCNFSLRQCCSPPILPPSD